MKLAERRVRLGLLLAEVGRKAEVTVTDAEMTQAVLQPPASIRARAAVLRIRAEEPADAAAAARALFEDKVVDHIVAQAKVTEKEVSKDKLQKAVEALDEI